MQSLAWHGQGDARVRREPFPRPPGASPQQGLPDPGPRGLYREARLLFLHGLLQELPAPQRALCFLQRLHRGLGQQEALGDTQWEARLRLPASELWSPFHADIFRSFSWSVNICGRKKWFFFPPGQEEALRDCHGGLPYDVTAPEFLDSHLHPVLEVTQEAGEMVFVPSGWHHQVHNLVGRTLSPSTITGSMAVTWPTCGISCSRSCVPCSKKSASGGTPCQTGTTTARSS
uniref:Jumonji domain-containing protein 4 n=1 Tax=Myotis myotis TaxID=51298 RepID=A0A7J7XGZ0_MYOMY|nr:jumonji domain containing 4 [Myotis myotis]